MTQESNATNILAAVACNLDKDILAACLPLMEEERVEALEWSFDALFSVKEVPAWFTELLTAFSHEGRLIGHGVFFSLFSGKWQPGQQEWLQQLGRVCADFQFDHITEHFGFMTGRDFHHGAPLNVPYNEATLSIGRDRLQRIYDVCRCPVGLENLAFSYSPDEVKRHGEFLEKLLAPVNGFIILDLHNLYCQLHNFDLSFDELVRLYPLHRVREIHISGGSWEDSVAEPRRQVRRDTHDGSVPEEVFRLLEKAMPLCPHLKYVVLEQLGNGLATEADRTAFYHDFLQLERMIVAANNLRIPGAPENFLPLSPVIPGPLVEDEMLYRQQLELSAILESAASYEDAVSLIGRSSLVGSDWHTEQWAPYMVETAMQIAQKWKKR